MTVFLAFIMFCFVWMIASYGTKLNLDYSNNKQKKIYIYGVSIFLCVIIGFRDKSIGVDTASYVKTFLHGIRQMSIHSVLGSVEPLYALLSFTIRLFSDNYTVYLFVIALIFVVSVGVLVYRYSKSPVISYIALLSFGFVYFAMAGLRQTVAISILFLAYKYVRERKLIPFLLLCIVAYGFHNTAIIFLLAYPLANIKITWKHFATLGIGYFLMSWKSEYVKKFLFDVLKWERLEGYKTYESSINLSGFIIQIAIIIFGLFYYRRVVENDSKDLSLYNFAFIGAFFQILTPIIGEFFRISMYFNIFNILLIANTCKCSKAYELRNIITIGVVFVLIIYFVLFSGNDPNYIPYYFFWKG